MLPTAHRAPPSPPQSTLPLLPSAAARLYHVREPETQALDMSFPDFVQCSQQWRARRLFLRVSRVVGCRWTGSGWGGVVSGWCGVSLAACLFKQGQAK